MTDLDLQRWGKRKDTRPAYARIHAFFMEQLAEARVGPGDRVPTELEFADAFGVSRATVQGAMARLVQEGVIERFPGRGTFISKQGRRAQIALGEVRSFEEEAAARGELVTFRLVSFGRTACPEAVARDFGVDAGAPVMTLERLRLIDGTVVGLELRFFAPSLALDFPISALERDATHTLIEEHLGIAIGRLDMTITAAIVDEGFAAKTGASVGQPLIVRDHAIFAVDDRLLVRGYSSYLPPYAFSYSAMLKRREGALVRRDKGGLAASRP